MRRFLSLSLCVLTLPASASDPPAADAPQAHHARQTWQQHFAQANLAHNGHLTLEEAKRVYPIVAKHFEDIDTDHKGYVTENDIRAWQAARRLGNPPEDKLRLRPAVNRVAITRLTEAPLADSPRSLPTPPLTYSPSTEK